MILADWSPLLRSLIILYVSEINSTNAMKILGFLYSEIKFIYAEKIIIME